MTAPFIDVPSSSSEESTETIIRWARVLLTVLLLRLGWHAFHEEYGQVFLVSDIDLAIHECGHMLLMPFGILIFGRTMMILGGSLFQVVFPLIFVGYFLWKREGKRQDVHAAMVCLWWTAINLLSVAIYCADARAGQLMLVNGLTGQESDAHDWNNLLFTWHALGKDTIIAGYMRTTALLLFWISIIVGLIAAWQSGRRPAATEQST